jgi:hypothetical protein
MPKPLLPAPAPKSSGPASVEFDPDDPGGYEATRDLAIKMLHGDDYWHEQIKRVLSAAGFKVRRIEQEETHPVWTMHLTRISFDLDRNNQTAAKQIRKLLRKRGVRIRRDELSVVSRSKDWIVCAFVLELGVPGVLGP